MKEPKISKLHIQRAVVLQQLKDKEYLVNFDLSLEEAFAEAEIPVSSLDPKFVFSNCSSELFEVGEKRVKISFSRYGSDGSFMKRALEDFQRSGYEAGTLRIGLAILRDNPEIKYAFEFSTFGTHITTNPKKSSGYSPLFKVGAGQRLVELKYRADNFRPLIHHLGFKFV